MEHMDMQDLIEYSRTTRVVKEVLRTDWFNVVLVCLEKGQDTLSPFKITFRPCT